MCEETCRQAIILVLLTKINISLNQLNINVFTYRYIISNLLLFLHFLYYQKFCKYHLQDIF